MVSSFGFDRHFSLHSSGSISSGKPKQNVQPHHPIVGLLIPRKRCVTMWYITFTFGHHSLQAARGVVYSSSFFGLKLLEWGGQANQTAKNKHTSLSAFWCFFPVIISIKYYCGCYHARFYCYLLRGSTTGHRNTSGDCNQLLRFDLFERVSCQVPFRTKANNAGHNCVFFLFCFVNILNAYSYQNDRPKSNYLVLFGFTFLKHITGSCYVVEILFNFCCFLSF